MWFYDPFLRDILCAVFDEIKLFPYKKSSPTDDKAAVERKAEEDLPYKITITEFEDQLFSDRRNKQGSRQTTTDLDQHQNLKILLSEI